MNAAAGSFSLLERYRSDGPSFDEAVDSTGALRPHWSKILEGLQGVGLAELQRRWEQAQQQILNDGVTFNPHDVDGRASRPWVLDAVPFPLAEAEWRGIMRGLEQRAHLHDLILRDLFGPQNLLRDRALPPDVLFRHPAYHPSYHELCSTHQRHVDMYASDLARAPDGSWWVTGARTRAPFGLGYVLENRIVASRMLVAAFRDARARRLADFYATLKDTLRKQAPHSNDNPPIALLTQGPDSPAFFEDAYLARYLGYTLAEGGDLAVRSNRLMLKTLGGLRPIEVLLRRVNDEECDPAELRADARAGVSGLLEAIRARNVWVANSPGAGLVESPILMAFLPDVCRRVLGEDLVLPSVATWWCGEPSGLAHVIDHLDELLIRPAFRVGDQPPVRAKDLSAEARDALVQRLRSHPESWVGQQAVERSTTPAWTSDGLAPWHLALRAFLVARESGWEGLPGGLARVSPDADVLDGTMTSGERSQDVWILAESAVGHTTLLPQPGESIALRRGGADLPSRVADNLFWLGRSIEQAEGIARLLRTALLSASDDDEALELAPLTWALVEGRHAAVGNGEDAEADARGWAATLADAVFDPKLESGLRATVSEAVRLISVVRDRVTPDAWRIVLRVEEASQPPEARGIDMADALAALDRVLTELSAFSGWIAESMTRAPAWSFLDLGRRIERAWHTARLLRCTMTAVREEEGPVLEAVLKTTDSIMTYRSRYLATVQAAPVLDLLLVDETNPRSIGYQLAVLSDHVDDLPRDEHQAGLGHEQRLARSLLNAVRLADVVELVASHRDERRVDLDRLLLRLADQLPRLSDALSGRFLIHAGLPRHLAAPTGTR